jgi:hypothetical protein
MRKTLIKKRHLTKEKSTLMTYMILVRSVIWPELKMSSEEAVM